jgi:acetyltransferase
METARDSKEKQLDKIFNPQTIAVIGASDKEGGVGNAVMKNLTENGYQGVVYPVNPGRETVHGIKAYKNISEVPAKIDLVIIVTPAATVPAIVEDCGNAGAAGLLIITAGFDEVGGDGKKMSLQIKEIANKYEMRVLGPNCLGFIRPSINLNASFSSKMALPGHIAFVSQSGALCTAILDWSLSNNVGFSHFVSIGEAMDISYHDLIEYYNDDPNTTALLIYMESLKEAEKFMQAAQVFSHTKPIAILKVGRTAAGAQAAKSHTGAITGNDEVYNAAFERVGILRVDSAMELFQLAKFFAMQNLPADNRVAVITNAGGPGVLATDFLTAKGGNLAKLEDSTMQKLNEFLPAAWSHNNPIDVLGDADSERYKKALEVCLNDKNVDAVAVILTPQEMTNPTDVAQAVISAANVSGKIIIASWMGGQGVAEGAAILEKNNIPCFNSPEEAISIFMDTDHYVKLQQNFKQKIELLPDSFQPKTEANQKIIKKITDAGRDTFTEAEAKKFLANYGIPVAKNGIAATPKDAAKISAKIGFPVVMKILSPDIMHKTDVGGVQLNIKNKAEAASAFKKIMSSVKKKAKNAKIDGVFIEAMTKKKFELLIGCKKDEVFGAAIVFGSGGTAVEVMRDTAIALAPLNMTLALQLMQKTKIYKLLAGYRGMPGANIEALQFLLCKFSQLLTDFPEITELDINPFAVDEKGGIALDAKIVIGN